jgi:catechol 2,3-dioxygenase-like lactoylglutathione lyase family enzyme
MTAELNHTIVWCHDRQRSADFLAEIFDRPAPRRFFDFLVVDLDNGVSMDFLQKEGDVARQHYAFLVDEAGFDTVLARIESKGIDWWADPAQSQLHAINHHFGGRGVYFEDPDGHLLEAITRPYGDPAEL